MSKFLEKHIHDSLMTYLVKFNKIALIGMISKWLESINEGSLIGTVMTDLKKSL